jgi:hypothetical protein
MKKITIICRYLLKRNELFNAIINAPYSKITTILVVIKAAALGLSL